MSPGGPRYLDPSSSAVSIPARSTARAKRRTAGRLGHGSQARIAPPGQRGGGNAGADSHAVATPAVTSADPVSFRRQRNAPTCDSGTASYWSCFFFGCGSCAVAGAAWSAGSVELPAGITAAEAGCCAGGGGGIAGVFTVDSRACLSPLSQTKSTASGFGGSGRLTSTDCLSPGPGSGVGRLKTSTRLAWSHPSF